jgi:hypothetical protein
MLTNKVRHFFSEPACVINRTWRQFIETKNAIGDSNAVIVLPESWGLMHNAGAISFGHICVYNHFESLGLVLAKKLGGDISSDRVQWLT